MYEPRMNPPWRQRLEPAITPLFRAWWRLKRAMTLGVRGLACDEAGRVLLVRHTYTAGWYLPGGGIETGESASAALTREMAEEGGIEIIGAPRLIGFYANHALYKNDHVALYRVDKWRACTPLENGEIAERGFFALDALPDGVTPGTRRRLDEVFGTADISAEW
jgi:ADP-ribose pyrophosphatase YjhB (NUDIX family)